MKALLRLWLIMIACVVGVAASAQAVQTAPEGWSPLLGPAELATILDAAPRVRVVHVSGGYVRGHIPDALHAPFEQWRGPADNPGALPPVAELQALVRSLGIRSDTPVVLVHAGSDTADMGIAARVYWTLKSLGVSDLAILNGGFRAWIDAGLPVAAGGVEAHPSDFTADWSDTWRITTAEMEQAVAQHEVRLIDAREPDFFEGRRATVALPGTIRGAGNLSYQTWFEGFRMVDTATARGLAALHGLESDTAAATFCNNGHLAAINWFALSELAGVYNTRLYAESMAEWTQASRPLDNGPGRLATYWAQTRNWLAGLF